MINVPEITDRVKTVVADYFGERKTDITMKTNFKSDLGADSLDAVDLIMEFEKEFGVQIPDDQAKKVATVGDVVAYIASLKK